MLRSTIALGVLSLGLVAAPVVARAQTAGSADPAATAQTPSKHHHRHALLRGIKLNADQKSQLKAIHAKYAPQIKQARQAKDRATVKQLHQQMLGEARGVLTPDQQKQFDSNLATVRAHRKAKGSEAAPSSAQTPSS